MPAKSHLVDLIKSEGLLEKYWNRHHVLLKGAAETGDFVHEDALQQLLDTGLLRWPYFTLVKENVRPELAAMSRARHVGGLDVRTFADPHAVRDLLAQGASLKLSQLEDWHLPTRKVMREIEALLPVELRAFMFYTPQGNTGLLPHRDPAHLLVVQISGAKEWRLYATPGQADARSGLDVEVDQSSDTFVMEPGDILYLPHGYPHAATARGSTSLHLTFTLKEPAPLDLAESLLTTFAKEGAPQLFKRHHRMRPEDKAEAVTRALSRHLECVDAGVLIETALRHMRRRTVLFVGYDQFSGFL